MSDPSFTVVRPHPSAEAAVPAEGQRVRVRYWAGARHAAGVESDVVAPGTVAQVVAAAVALRPGLTAVTAVCSILVNGVASEPHASVAPGSVVEVLPPFAGG